MYLPQDLPKPLLVAPPRTETPFLPFSKLPRIPLEESNNGYGIAQRMCRARGVQGRLLWIDATANLDAINTPEKIGALVTKIKTVGFNTIVLDVKPIIGQTLYPSQFAPKLVEWVRPWKTQRLPQDFDPLKVMVAEAHRQKLGLIVSLNAFSEGHREFPGQGLGEKNPAWQTVLYENSLSLRSGSAMMTLSDTANTPSGTDQLTLYTDPSKRKPETALLSVALGPRGEVVAGELPPSGGALLAASGEKSSAFLRESAALGTALSLEVQPRFVKIADQTLRQVPLMVSPHNPEVRERLLKIVGELSTSYEIDGLIFDDRLRYASLGADFSDDARRAFEQWLGKRVTRWPEDIFRWEVRFPALSRYAVPGPHYEAWLTFRAMTMRNVVADIVRTAKTIKPELRVGTYVGSWYPDYPDLGANWGADDLQAGFHFLNDSYRACGWASLVDFVVTGCYYRVASIREAAERGIGIGDTVEAAGQFSNRAVNDATFVYAGLSLELFQGKPEELRRTLQAAAATTQGVMCFDLSHNIEALWPIFTEAFEQPALAPHAVPGLLDELRRRKAEKKAAGIAPPPVILYRGTSGTGF